MARQMNGYQTRVGASERPLRGYQRDEQVVLTLGDEQFHFDPDVALNLANKMSKYARLLKGSRS